MSFIPETWIDGEGNDVEMAVLFEDWAYDQIARHEDIAHVQITITHKDGSKTDYMQSGDGEIIERGGVADASRKHWNIE